MFCLDGTVPTPFVEGFLARSYPDSADDVRQQLYACQPLSLMSRPEIAAAAFYLASDKAAFVTCSALVIDGG